MSAKKSWLAILTGLTVTCTAMEINFTSGEIGKGISPYGEGTRLAIAPEGEKGGNALIIHYNDKTPGKWCNKGVWITLPRSISWDEFKAVTVKFRQSRDIRSIGCTLQDEKGNMWYTDRGDTIVLSGAELLVMPKDVFRFSYNPGDRSIRSAEKSAAIKKMLFYIGTRELNTDREYTFALEEIKFGEPPVKADKKDLPADGKTPEVSFANGIIPRGTYAYGDGTKLGIDALGRNGNKALVIHYNDKTPGKWCNKGVWITLPRSVSWDEFDFLTIQYRQASGIKAIACILQDEKGNMWYNHGGEINKKLFNDLNYEKRTFRFSYNIGDKSVKKAEKNIPVTKMLFYVGTDKLNTDRQYQFVLEGIKFGRYQDKIAMTVIPRPDNVAAFGEYGDIRNTVSDSVRSSVRDGVITLQFKDDSPDRWYHKGVRIRLDKPIDWKDFVGVAAGYEVSEAGSSIGCYLRDGDGVWWESFVGQKAGGMQKAFFSRDSFNVGQLTYRYFDKKYAKKGKIDEIFLYFGSIKVNKGNSISVTFKDISFIRELSFGNYKYEIVDDFPLQWKNNRITKDGVMMVDGKPFFPLVLYSCMGIDRSSGTYYITHYTGPTDDAANRKRFKAIRDAGFNAMMSYTINLYGQKVSGPGWKGAERANFPGEGGETSPELYREGARKFMDYCHSAGLKAMIGAYSTYTMPRALPLDDRGGKWAEYKKRIAANIAALKDHPALLAWYMIDEPSSINIPKEDLIQCYQFAKKLDQDHPFLIAAADFRNDVEYFKAMDIVAPDSYPLGFDKPISNDYTLMERYIAEQQNGNPRIWQLIQIAMWQNWGPRPLPTCEQIRLQCFLAMLRNVKGLCFWEHMNYPEREPAHWENVGKAVKSLHSFTDDLLNSEKIIDAPRSSNPKILSIVHRVRGKKYILMLAANPAEEKIGDSPTPQPVAQGRVKFDFPGLKIGKIEVIDENGNGELALGKTRIIKPDGIGSFSDDFGKYASHAYKIYTKD